MVEQAIAKIRAEMNAMPDNTYIQVVGHFVVLHLQAHPEDADKVLVQDKTIAKSLDTMRTEAQRKSRGGVAVLTDEEGFTAVLRYFGAGGEVPTRNGVALAADALAANKHAVPAPITSGRPSDFDVKLDDFL